MTPGRVVGFFLDKPSWIKLNWFGAVVYDAFGETPELVGSALHTKDWRDVDVRLVLDAKSYAEQIGEPEGPRSLNPRANAFCVAFSALGSDMTGLPIDFQIDREDDAERYANLPSAPLGALTTLWTPEEVAA